MLMFSLNFTTKAINNSFNVTKNFFIKEEEKFLSYDRQCFSMCVLPNSDRYSVLIINSVTNFLSNYKFNLCTGYRAAYLLCHNGKRANINNIF